MFNGIIYNQGRVYRIQKRKKGLNIFLKSSLKISKRNLGDSISCDGVCLTLISYKNKILEFYLSNETLIKSKFKKIKLNDDINIELPLEYILVSAIFSNSFKLLLNSPTTPSKTSLF